MSGSAVFFDKDGTLIEDIPYHADPDLLRLLPGAIEALGSLQSLGYRLIVVTNQSGVARGYFGEEQINRVEQRLRDLLSAAGVLLAGFYYCPHHPDGAIEKYAVECTCRKPQPGMLHKAAREHGLDLGRCWMVGDALRDIEAGQRAGCRTVLLAGDDAQAAASSLGRPDATVENLQQAAQVIAAHSLLQREMTHGE